MKHNSKNQRRLHRHARKSFRMKDKNDLPKLMVFKSNRQIYVQLIDYHQAKTITASNSLQLDTKNKSATMKTAALVGTNIAKKIKKLNITKIVFITAGLAYHGQIKVLAEKVREEGIQF